MQTKHILSMFLVFYFVPVSFPQLPPQHTMAVGALSLDPLLFRSRGSRGQAPCPWAAGMLGMKNLTG